MLSSCLVQDSGTFHWNYFIYWLKKIWQNCKNPNSLSLNTTVHGLLSIGNTDLLSQIPPKDCWPTLRIRSTFPFHHRTCSEETFYPFSCIHNPIFTYNSNKATWQPWIYLIISAFSYTKLENNCIPQSFQLLFILIMPS